MLLHSDGFDSHAAGSATLADGNPGWGAQSGVTVTASAGKFGGKSLRRAAAVDGYARFTNAGTEKGFAAYFSLGTFGGSAEADLLRVGGGGNQSLLTVDEAGVLAVYDGAGNARITTAAGAFVGADYPWVEVDFLSAGINLYVNGTLAGNYTGAYTAVGGSFDWLGAAPTNTPATDVDDALSWDAAGSYFNTFPVRPRRIHLLQADAGGDSTQWAPASGDNYAAVTATDWTGGVGVSAASAGLKDLYQLSGLANTPAQVDAVVVRTLVENTGDNPANLLHTIKGTDAAEANSNAQAVSTSGPTVLQSVFYRDAAGAPWTATNVSGLQAGMISSN